MTKQTIPIVSNIDIGDITVGVYEYLRYTRIDTFILIGPALPRIFI